MFPLSLVAVRDSFTGEEIPCGDILAAAAALEPVPELPGGGPDRFLEIRGACGGFVSIYVSPRESLAVALLQSAADLADPSLCFESEGEERLARAAVPELLRQLGKLGEPPVR